VLPLVAVGLLLALASGRSLNALALGEETARGLGQRTGLARFAVAFAVVLLAAAAVAAAGPIAFVGLTVPHAARALVGSDYRWIIPFATLLGAALLLGADVLGRIVARPEELQVGIVTALVGAPVFIWLVRRRRPAEL
jgi:iron complex transport system permease protein